LNLRKLTTTAIVFLALSLTSCGTARRAGKDLFLGIGTPVLMLYGGGTDAAATAQEVEAGLGGSAATEFFATVVSFPFHAIKHGFYGLVHAADFFLFPIYGLAELHPYGPDIEPLDYYTGTWFDRSDDETGTGTDAETGEPLVEPIR
jgi:predicted small secreted protein